ncbi:MAG: Glycine cleavage system H protein [Syntrophorhabdus sp. PtaU1.Bin058]|nr:MAG: Glycine cleavage system H protein [Syntrophorhabdus sp. PtaU1.Bin058]
MYPDELRYNEEHTWLLVEETKLGRVGITHYAQEQLKDVVFIELPEVGAEVVHMEPFGVIESVKATNDLFSPVSGVVVKVNDMLKDDPGIVNQDPYGKGWMIVVELTNPSELGSLMSSEEYAVLVEE